jgi:RNA polymerase sigma-54 factor
MFQLQAANMHMTPQLRKAITMLQLSTPELLALVHQEFTENPLLELTGNEWDVAHPSSTPIRTPRRDQHDAPVLDVISREITLEVHLKEQLSFAGKIPLPIHRIIVFMIGNLDANGLLVLSLPEICEACKADLDQAEQALRILQRFEPVGIAARDVKECLLLQLKALPRQDPLVSLLVQHHLQDVADYRTHKLSKLLQVTPHDLHDAIEVIKGLNPRPGAVFFQEAVSYLMPEVLIEVIGDQLSVALYETTSANLSINRHYERMVTGGSGTDETTKYLTGRLRSAKFFLQCLEQRRKTIFRVAQAIAVEQSEFFWQGAAHLKPMTLKHIADQLGVHESTVSRATSGKYAQTPWGIFELKHFFPSGLQVDTGEATSSTQVKAFIQDWISRENQEKPLSDQKIVSLLKQAGIDVSRRTITKYREELGISSSIRRKRI